jgi:hypothetical protein
MKRLLLAMLLAALSAPAFAGQLIIRNNSSWDFHYVYISPSSQGEWGPDQLGNDTIPSGSSYNFTGVGCNTWDVKIVDEDGDTCQLMNRRICGTVDWSFNNRDWLNCIGN